MMRNFIGALIICILFLAGYVVAVSYSHTDLARLPPLESGDLIFETSLTHQSPAVMMATASLYTHVGVIHKHDDGSYSVIQAKRKVVETSLTDFLRDGWGERITIKRYPELTDEQRAAIVEESTKYLGRGYNYEFYLPAHEVYCSEIPYLAFESQHIPLGKMQKIGELHMNNPLTRKLFEERWKSHPACQAKDMDYMKCWQKVLDEPIITPASVAKDPKLTTIYSNYLF